MCDSMFCPELRWPPEDEASGVAMVAQGRVTSGGASGSASARLTPH